MNLIVDIGNSRIKIAIFNKDELIYNEVITNDSFVETSLNLIEKFNCKNAIISAVGILNNSEIDQIKAKIKVIELNPTTKIPFFNNYATPKTLGVDRIALVAAAAAPPHAPPPPVAAAEKIRLPKLLQRRYTALSSNCDAVFKENAPTYSR